MKILGIFAVSLGLVMIFFSVMAWRELHRVTTSGSAPSADSMPLTRVVNPAIFDAGNVGQQPVKPAELVQAAFSRIYLIGGVSFAITVLGVVLLLSRGPRSGESSSSGKT